MRILIAILAALFASAALAATATVTWTLPTTNTDSSAIPATGAGSISSTRVEWGSCNGTAFGTAAGQVIVPVPALTTTINNLAPGTYCFRAYATNTYAIESAPTNAALKVVPAPTPNPPVLVTVAVIAGVQYTPVYSVASTGKISTFMGMADLGKSCTGPALFTYRGATFHEVARADVHMWGATTLRLAAPCKGA